MNRPIVLRELGDTERDHAALAAFYSDVYVPAFPDADERESLANIARYLERKAQGWYGANNYHVVIAEHAEATLGGYIADYLEIPNAGVIEFLFTVPAARGEGVGRRLLDHVGTLFRQDARAAGHASLQWIAAEMNDPYAVVTVPDNLDPFLRAQIWSGWGFGALEFPYVQPALSPNQHPVTGLLLIAKIFDAGWHGRIPAARVDALVAEYLRWAMRLEKPARSAEYRAMKGWLERCEWVALKPLDQLIGGGPFDVTELRSASTPEFEAAIAVYSTAFPSRATSITPTSFASNLGRYDETGYRYHLWAVREATSGRVAGMASFFSFATLGFGGYVALEGALRGAGLLRPLLARIERQMHEDSPALHGWLIECEGEAAAAIFGRCGFAELALDYRQPELPGAMTAPTPPPLRLLYKPLGNSYARPDLDRDEFLRGLADVLHFVYRVAEPQGHATYRAVAAQTAKGIVFR